MELKFFARQIYLSQNENAREMCQARRRIKYFGLYRTILDSPCATVLRQGGGNISRGLLEACLRNQDEWPSRETVKQSRLFTQSFANVAVARQSNHSPRYPSAKIIFHGPRKTIERWILTKSFISRINRKFSRKLVIIIVRTRSKSNNTAQIPMLNEPQGLILYGILFSIL